MTTAMMLPVCERLNAIGYAAVDLMGLVHFDVCVRYLEEDPWQRIRLVRERITDVPLKSYIRSKSLIGFDVLPDDVNALWVQRLVANGIGMVCAFDALTDLDNIVPNLLLAKQCGAITCGALVFSESPVHTDAFFVAKAKELVARAQVDWLMIKDSGGLLGIDRVRTLIPALRAAVPDTPIELHSHCLTGITPLVYHEAVKAGVDIVDTSIAPLANGAAQPATQTMVRNLRELGFAANVDMSTIEEIGAYWQQVADQEGLPVGRPHAFDAFHYRHQLPGGMLTNLQFQLSAAGLGHRFRDVLEECVRIREELAWPVMVTPFAQLVGTQAVLNLVHRDRYRIVPDQIKKYALGYYGRLLAPVQPDILDRIVSNGSGRIATAPQPPPPGLPGLRRRYPNLGDDERLLRYCFAGSQVDKMLARGSSPAPYSLHKPLHRLISGLSARRGWQEIRIRASDLELTARAAQ